MQWIASLFVQKPLNILVVAALFAAGYCLLRFTALGERKHYSALLVPTITWGLYAAWEWLVLWKTPGADIRVDLLLIFPVLLIVSVWFTIRALR
jgi:hypothetical protein